MRFSPPRPFIYLLALGLCMASLSAHFVADGLSQPARESCRCPAQAATPDLSETCDSHGGFVLPCLSRVSPPLSLSVAQATADWCSYSQRPAPRLPPPKA